MTDITKVSTKGQIVIPQEMRDALGLEAGSTLALEQIDDFLVLRKIVVPRLGVDFKAARRKLRAKAKKLGILNEQDVVALVRQFRRTHGKALRKAVGG
jgi:AbrB family looped-hinge helix DNA binding protein